MATSSEHAGAVDLSTVVVAVAMLSNERKKND